MRSSEVFTRVEKMAGSKIPDQSVYQALRTLVRRKVLSVRRAGRERIYTLIDAVAKAPRGRPPKAKGVAATPMPAPAAADRPVATTVQHKLAPGEIVILEIGDSHLEVATNVHGKLVVERHRRTA